MRRSVSCLVVEESVKWNLTLTDRLFGIFQKRLSNFFFDWVRRADAVATHLNIHFIKFWNSLNFYFSFVIDVFLLLFARAPLLQHSHVGRHTLLLDVKRSMNLSIDAWQTLNLKRNLWNQVSSSSFFFWFWFFLKKKSIFVLFFKKN